jgi:histidine triad (HIT) family protein
MKEDCIFCKIVKGEIPCGKLYEDETVLAFLDVSPWSKGHCLVIPKAHYSSLDECPGEIVAAVSQKIPLVARAVVKVVQADAYNVLNNNGRAAGQLVNHVHFHIIPRKSNDGIISHAPHGKPNSGELEDLAQRISQEL